MLLDLIHRCVYKNNVHMYDRPISFIFNYSCYYQGFPGSSAGKESACNAGDPSLILGLGRSVGEGIGYPLQYSWVFLVA